MVLSQNFKDLKTAEDAYERVKLEIEAVPLDALALLNVDIVSATATVLGVADGILAFKERLALLPEFDQKSVNSLIDYALAAWYLYVTNLPAAEPADADMLLSEMQALRAKLLLWAGPLAASGLFEADALSRIKEGSSNKDAASDVVALVGLYRSRWSEVSTMCGVTEADLVRGAEIGPIAFALVARRENKVTATPSDASQRIRRAWTLVDKAYAQCRRGIEYLRFEEQDVDRIAPNLRRNSGVRATPSAATPSAATLSAATTTPGATAPGVATAVSGAALSSTQQAAATGLTGQREAGTAIGGTGGPFVAPQTG